MDPENKEQVEDQAGAAEVDPWAAAFAALDKTEEEAPAADTDGADGDVQDTGEAGAAEDAAGPEAGDGEEVPPAAGGSGDLGGADSGTDARAEESIFSFTEEEANEYRESLKQAVEEQTIKDVAAAYIKQGYRHTNGRLGATVNDPDICKRDSDGMPKFYNPETGREFTGDNPRRQAQEWVDDYNRELANAFNQTCADYAKKLMEEKGHGLKIIEFAPKYEQLDPVRRAMFESIIEGYEIHDKDGDTIGYSCDLDKALEAVNRQVRVMQERFKGTGQAAPAKPEPSGPALDMKNSGNRESDDKMPEFKSTAEAMEYLQDQQLKKLKERK